MYKVLRKNKSYDKRKLVIYDEKDKKIVEVTGFWGWICWSKSLDLETFKVIRLDVMKNLYWLLGHDCDKEDWLKSIEKWDKGFHYGPQQDSPTSKFFNEVEKELAINSFIKEE